MKPALNWLNLSLQTHLFLTPRPRRLRKTGGPGTYLEFALQIVFGSFFTSFARGAFLMPCLHYKKMFANVFHAQTFAGGTFWREIHSPIFKCQKQQATSRCKVSSLTTGALSHPRCAHKSYVMKTLRFIATFEYLNG